MNANIVMSEKLQQLFLFIYVFFLINENAGGFHVIYNC